MIGATGLVLRSPHTIALVLETTRMTAKEAAAIASAVHYQLAHDVAPAWGILAPRVIAVAAGDRLDGAKARLHLVDSLPEAPDALGYHTEDATGVIDGKIGVGVVLDSGGAVLSGADSVAAVVSHEVIELALDPTVNGWYDAPDGYSYPVEGCDAVQGDAYPLDGSLVSGSNFLLPAWFDPYSSGPYDHLGKVAKPFTLAKGGYTVRRKRGTGETQIFGARPAWRPALRSPRRRAV